MVTAVKRPAGETRGKLAAGPGAGQCHRASPRPYSKDESGKRDVGARPGRHADIQEIAGKARSPR